MLQDSLEKLFSQHYSQPFLYIRESRKGLRIFRLKIETENYVHSIYVGQDFQHRDRNSALRLIEKFGRSQVFNFVCQDPQIS